MCGAGSIFFLYVALRHDADGPARVQPGTQDILVRLTVARQQTFMYEVHSTDGPNLALRILFQTILIRHTITKLMAQQLLQLHHPHHTRMRLLEPLKKDPSPPVRTPNRALLAPRLHRLSLCGASKARSRPRMCAPNIPALLFD